jgi:TonB family protein
MRNKGIVLIACGLALASWCVAQDNKALEHDLSNHYIGKEFHPREVYANREVWFDRNGDITESPRLVCPGLYGKLVAKRIRVQGNVLSVEMDRSALYPPLRGGKTAYPRDYIKEVTLRFQSSQPWTADSFDRAFQNSLHSHRRFDPRLPGASASPPASDSRMLFLLDGQPVYKVAPGIKPPVANSRPDPEYTEVARRAKVGGEVQLRLIVNEDGSVSNVEAAQPALGYGLDEAAVRAVSQWRFTPALLDGKPVKTLLNVETSFCLY